MHPPTLQMVICDSSSTFIHCACLYPQQTMYHPQKMREKGLKFAQCMCIVLAITYNLLCAGSPNNVQLPVEQSLRSTCIIASH